MLLTPAALVSKWNTRFATNDTFEITEADLREYVQDVADSFGLSSFEVFTGTSGVPQAVKQGFIYFVQGQQLWRARRTFNASAAPMAGPNWELLLNAPAPATSYQALAVAAAQTLAADADAIRSIRYRVLRTIGAGDVETYGLPSDQANNLPGAFSEEVDWQNPATGQWERKRYDVATDTLGPSRVDTLESDLVDLENEVLVIENDVEANRINIDTLNTKVAGLASSDRRVGIWNAQTNTIVGTSTALAETTGATSGSQAAALRGRYYEVQATTAPFTTTATADTPGGATGITVASTAGLGVGHTVTGAGIPAGTRVLQLLGTNTVLTNNTNTVLTGAALTFTPSWNGISQFYEKDLLYCDGFNYYLRPGLARLQAGGTGGSTGPWPSFTNPVTDDVNKVFKATLPDNFRTTAAEYTLDGGTTTTIASEAQRSGNVLSAPVTGNKAIGQVGWRLRADAGRPAGAWLFNEAAFTALVTNLVWQEDNPGITYSAGDWSTTSAPMPGYFGAGYRTTSVINANFTLTVPAGYTGLSMQGHKDPGGSWFRVFRNGTEVVRSDQYDGGNVTAEYFDRDPSGAAIPNNRITVASGDVIEFRRTYSPGTTTVNGPNFADQITFHP